MIGSGGKVAIKKCPTTSSFFSLSAPPVWGFACEEGALVPRLSLHPIPSHALHFPLLRFAVVREEWKREEKSYFSKQTRVVCKVPSKDSLRETHSTGFAIGDSL